MTNEARSAPVRATEATLAGEDTLDGRLPRSEDAELRRGTCVGRYVVVDKLGVGGMGVVYAAYDPELDRKVALKLIRTSRLTPRRAERRRRRLIREAQAMARLNHPNVVAVHDVGTHEGQVFVAMEFIDGPDLKTWLKTGTRAWREVVDVFVAVARGLTAAHQAGVIHRDLKPDNVMIGSDGRVRVMDLGLARGSGSKDTVSVDPDYSASDSMLDASLTRDGVLVGTPAYMAPEMHKGLEVDARADQFSFCVALFEALYGQRPFAGTTLASLAVEISNGRIVDPPPDRQVPAWLRKIVYRGLSTDPGQRYPTMEVLANDLERDRTRPRKIAWVAGTALVVAGAAAWIAGALGGETSPCEAGRDRIDEVWDGQRREAIQTAFAATKMPFSDRAFAAVEAATSDYADAWAQMHRETCEETRVYGRQSDELLDLRMACLDRRRNELRALLDVLTDADATTVEQAEKAVAGLTPLDVCSNADALRATVPLPDSAAAQKQIQRIRDLMAKARAQRATGRTAEARQPSREAVVIARELDHAPTLAEALLELGRTQASVTEPVEARASLEEALEVAAAGKHDEAAANIWLELVDVMGVSLESPDALVLQSAVRSAVARIGDPPQQLARFHRNVGMAYRTAGHYDEARTHLQKALALAEDNLGTDHPTYGATLQSLGVLAIQSGRLEEARDYLERAYAQDLAQHGPDHPQTAVAQEALGLVALRQGHLDEAQEQIEAARALREANLPPHHRDIARSYMNLALVAYERGDIDSAIEQEQRALDMLRKSLGPDHPDVAAVIGNLGTSFAEAGRHDEAVEHHQRALELTERNFGAKHPRVARHHNNLGYSLHQLGKNDEALPHLEHALELWTEVGGPEHPETGLAAYNLANVHRELGHPDQAVLYAQRAVAIRKQAFGERHLLFASARFALTRALWAAGRHEQARTEAEAIKAMLVDLKEDPADIETWLIEHRAR